MEKYNPLSLSIFVDCCYTPFLPNPHSDSGDHNDGPGLVSSSSQGADVSDYLLSELQYDVMAIGNHEMYREDVVDRVYKRAQEGRW
jgi:hypothetical protein